MGCYCPQYPSKQSPRPVAVDSEMGHLRTLAVQKYLVHEGYRRNGAGGRVSAPPFHAGCGHATGLPRAAMGVKKRAGYSAT